MNIAFRQNAKGWADRTSVMVLDGGGKDDFVAITFRDGSTVVLKAQDARQIHEFLGAALQFLDQAGATGDEDADQQAQRDVEAATADLDDQIALSFGDVSAEKDGGVSAEVVRTLKRPMDQVELSEFGRQAMLQYNPNASEAELQRAESFAAGFARDQEA